MVVSLLMPSPVLSFREERSSAQKRNAQPVLHPLDSRFRWNDENDKPVIPGKAAGRGPESRSRKLDSRLHENDKQGYPLVSASMFNAARYGFAHSV
jgi:hypothetical protein